MSFNRSDREFAVYCMFCIMGALFSTVLWLLIEALHWL